MTYLQYPAPNLTDGVALLRPWTLDDLKCVQEAATDPRIPPGTTVPPVYSDEEGRAFIERQLSRQTNGEGLALAVVDAALSEAIGQIVLLFRPQQGVAGIGYWVVPRARGQGFATRAVHLLTNWALALPEIVRIEALVEPENTESIRVLEKSGFQREGLLRSYLPVNSSRSDAYIYSLLREDPIP